MPFYGRRLETFMRSLERHHPENVELVKKFVEDLRIENISELRIASYVSYLKKFVDITGRRLDEFTENDVRKVIAHYQKLVQEGERTESSVFEAKKTLKKFFKWMKKPELVEWFSIGKVENELSPSDLITEEEFRKLMNACMNSRDRAMISLLYESGARIGEIGSMRVKDVSFDDYGAVVWFPLRNSKSKKHKRKVRVVFSTRYLAEWLADHPIRDDPESPLWIQISGRRAGEAMNYDGIRLMVKRLVKRAGLKKRIYPHLFRHTRATRLLSRMSETVVSKYMGWVLGTRMVRTYAHLADEDVDNAILELHGLQPKNNGQDLEVRQCPRCVQVNPAENRFCSRCGLPMTEEAMREVEKEEEVVKEVVKLATSPDGLKKLMELSDKVKLLEEEVRKLKK